MIDLLLDHGARFEAKDQTGATPLRKAIDRMIFGDGKIIPASDPRRFNNLVKKGADRFAADNARVKVQELVDTDHWTFDEVDRPHRSL